MKDDLIALGASILMLLGCVGLYTLGRGFEIIGFPTYQVLAALPIAFGVWLICALADPQKYRRVIPFFSNMIFCTTVFTGLFIFTWK